MAYILHHTAFFKNKITQDIEIRLYKKDTATPAVTSLRVVECKKKYLTGQSNGSDTIITSELDFTIFINRLSDLSYEDFLVSFHDEWKVELRCDTQLEFVGFITPGEGGSSLKNPYLISITASDNLGLLKETPLVKQDGTNFSGVNTLSSYLCAALYAANPDMVLRIYSSIYEGSMPDRNALATSDNFNQSTANYRTFLKDPILFVDCYTALEKILEGGYCLFQYFGLWLIMRYGEFQTNVGPKIWYTDYNLATGTPIGGVLDLLGPAQIGKQQALFLTNNDHVISADFAIKSARYSYDYKVWEELPLNNKFERGTFIPGVGVDDPVAGTTQKAFTIDGWIFGTVLPGSPSSFPPNMQLSTDIAYRLSTYDSFGVEINREVVLENDGNPGHRMLMSEAIPAKAFTKIGIDFDFKRTPGGDGTMNYAFIFLLPTAGGLPYRLDNDNPVTGGAPFRWVRDGALIFPSKFYQGENWQDYSGISIAAPAIPEDGILYFCFLNYDSSNSKVYYRNFSFTYTPFVAGGYVKVVGDAWLTQQNLPYKDNVDLPVLISDSPHKVFQGALLRANGVDLTTRSWHRLNVNEARDYKEVLNLARYNQAYRRMWKISGTFGGTKYMWIENETYQYPLGFHKHFFFRDNPKLEGKYFQLVPPLSLDFVEGNFEGVFRESLDLSQPDGNDDGDLHEFKFRFS